MTSDRERDIIHAFADLSSELVGEYDVIDMLGQLVNRCAALLDVASAGLLLAKPDGLLHLVASSSERAHHLEVLQLQREEGPCLDCYRDQEPVIVPDLSVERARWPGFHDAARATGFRSVHALPMRFAGIPLGTLGLFGERVGRLDEDDLALAQALVHVASVILVHEPGPAHRGAIDQRLQRALLSRVVVEQAKGVIAEAGDTSMEEAFSFLRRFARSHGRSLDELAADVVALRLPAETLLQHA